MTMLINPYRYADAEPAFSPLDIDWHTAFWAEDPNWTNPGNAGAVSQWDDASGNGHHATQATPSLQPTYYDSIADFNGKAGIRAVSNRLQTSSFTALSTATIVSVFNIRQSTSAARWVYDGITSTNRMLLAGDNFPVEWLLFNGTLVNGGGWTNNLTYFTVARYLASDSLTVKGTTVISGANAGSQSLTGITLFDRYDQTAPTSVDMAFFGVYDGNLPALDEAALETWAANHYGIAIA